MPVPAHPLFVWNLQTICPVGGTRTHIQLRRASKTRASYSSCATTGCCVHSRSRTDTPYGTAFLEQLGYQLQHMDKIFIGSTTDKYCLSVIVPIFKVSRYLRTFTLCILRGLNPRLSACNTDTLPD